VCHLIEKYVTDFKGEIRDGIRIRNDERKEGLKKCII
jgi:hypothetical protein